MRVVAGFVFVLNFFLHIFIIISIFFIIVVSVVHQKTSENVHLCDVSWCIGLSYGIKVAGTLMLTRATTLQTCAGAH